MDNAQLTILVSALSAGGAALAASLRWAVNRIVKALDDNSTAHREAAQANLEQAKALVALAVKVDNMSGRIDQVGNKVDRVAEWVDDTRDATPVERPKLPTTYLKKG